jgi:hypothetical protein
MKNLNTNVVLTKMRQRIMKEPNWKFFETKTKRINIIEIDPKRSEIDALDLEASVPFILNVPDSKLLQEIEKGENYMVTFRVFKAKMTREYEKAMYKVSDSAAMKLIKENGGDLFKFELVSVEEA